MADGGSSWNEKLAPERVRPGGLITSTEPRAGARPSKSMTVRPASRHRRLRGRRRRSGRRSSASRTRARSLPRPPGAGAAAFLFPPPPALVCARNGGRVNVCASAQLVFDRKLPQRTRWAASPRSLSPRAEGGARGEQPVRRSVVDAACPKRAHWATGSAAYRADSVAGPHPGRPGADRRDGAGRARLRDRAPAGGPAK